MTCLASIVVAVGDTDTTGAFARLSNATAVSEPGTLALLVLGLIGLATVRRQSAK